MAKKARKTTKKARRPRRPARSARKRAASARKRPSSARKRTAARRSGKRSSKAQTRTPERVPTPPSSLDMVRKSSAVRTGRAGLRHSLDDHGKISPAITGGDVDADWENAYFSGDEAPGGDNPTPDQDVVDEIGRSLGVEYQDNEELKSSEKVDERDKHRWELDPASSEDYKERD